MGKGLARIAVSLVVVIATGCGSDGKLQAVTGVVTFKGKPLDSGTIQFFAVDGPPGPAGGTMIKDGRYELPSSHGLVPGKYKITISSPEIDTTKKGEAMMGGMPVTKDRIPEQFNTKSTQIIEVQSSGSNKLDFTID